MKFISNSVLKRYSETIFTLSIFSIFLMFSNPSAHAACIVPLAGDADCDGYVNQADINTVMASWGSTDLQADVNGDGVISFADVTFILANWNKSIPGNPAYVPILEPGTGGAVTPPDSTSLEAAVPGPMAIARWDVVPMQMITAPLKVGVVAFHKDGIKHVAFSLNNGPAVNVASMMLNPTTGVYEYVATVDPRLVADGKITVTATAVPNVGTPRVLDPLILVANSRNTLQHQERYVSVTGNDTTGTGTRINPFKTIYKAALSIQTAQSPAADCTPNGPKTYCASNGTIYLLAGDHVYSTRPSGGSTIYTPQGWLTIKAASGVSRDSVRIVNIVGNTLGALNASYQKIEGVTMYQTGVGGNASLTPSLWYDNVLVQGVNTATSTSFAPPTTWTGGIYMTNSEIRNIQNGTSKGTLLRNIKMSGIGSDAVHNVNMALNVTVSDLRKPSGTTFHPDVVQIEGAFENVIVYGLKAVSNVCAQTIFSRGTDPLNNAAFVNILINNYIPSVDPNDPDKNDCDYKGAWSRNSDHLLFWNVTHRGNSYAFDSLDGTSPRMVTNLSIRNSVFEAIAYAREYPRPSTTIANLHLIRGYLTTAYPVPPKTSGVPIDTDPDPTSPTGTNGTTVPGLTKGGLTSTGYLDNSLFVNHAANDFHPKTGALRLAAGQKNMTPNDVDNNLRSSFSTKGAY